MSADDYAWPAITADLLRAQLDATRKADEAERMGRLLGGEDE